MQEFSQYIAEQWDISKQLAKKICDHFEKGDSIFYLNDYVPEISSELGISLLADIYAKLQEIADLAPKKKRVITTLTKAEALTKSIEKRIQLSTKGRELDDLILPFRPNTRSRGQRAIKMGLEKLADICYEQEVEEGSLEDLAQEYVGKDKALKTVEDVLNGVKDILAERYASDEEVRTMAREVGYENGFIEVLPKNKKDKRYAIYRGKMVPVPEITPEEYLSLRDAEEKKEIRLKNGIQLFHINELLRHHFIENPDFIGFDFICETIEECWSRLLQPMVETYVKNRLYTKAEKWALQKVDKDLQTAISTTEAATTVFAISLSEDNTLIIVALTNRGNMLGATSETIDIGKGNLFSSRVKQFYVRYKPSRAIIMDNPLADKAVTITTNTLKSMAGDIPVEKKSASGNLKGLVKSQWMQERYAVLEDPMKEVFAFGLALLQPLSIIPQIGVKYIPFHAMQKHIRDEQLEALLMRIITEYELHKGIPFYDSPDSVLKNLACVSDEILLNIRKEGAKKPFETKNSLLEIKGMTEIIFRNITGYLIIPKAKNILDRTTVHPDHFDVATAISSEINASLESMVSNPELVGEFASSDPIETTYINQKLRGQLATGQQYPLLAGSSKRQRRLRLSELTLNSVVTGKVTNITDFGVFVDINAVCDGLVHISQLANGYIETADQVVKPNDSVDVKILKVDKKKRRISLSMKKTGSKPPKVRPSSNQLSTLADHFKNR